MILFHFFESYNYLANMSVLEQCIPHSRLLTEPALYDLSLPSTIVKYSLVFLTWYLLINQEVYALKLFERSASDLMQG